MRNTNLFSDYPDVMSVAQMSDALGISKRTAYDLIEAKLIKIFHIGRSIKVPKISLIEYVVNAMKGSDSDDCKK